MDLNLQPRQKKRVSGFTMTYELSDQIRDEADRLEVSMSELVVAVMTAYFESVEKHPPKKRKKK